MDLEHPDVHRSYPRQALHGYSREFRLLEFCRAHMDTDLSSPLLGAEVAVMVPSKLSLWYGILVGALAFFADQQITYSLVPHACSTGHFYVLYWATGIALLLALSGAAVGAKNL